MKLSIGIVGLPNVGKSTLFKILTKQEVHIANYPFATIAPNVGIVTVPDERLDKLHAISRSKKIVPAVVEFYDIAGLVKGANTGEGLGNQFLAHIRETQAIIIVIRLFSNSEIVHIEGTVAPLRDLEIINTELALKDLETAEKSLSKAASDSKGGNKEAIQEYETLEKITERLAQGNLLIASAELMSLIRVNKRISDFGFLTAKKQLYLLNGKKEEASEALIEKITSLGADYLIVDLAAASEISELIKKSYEILDLISFFTTGEDETRAWTIKRGTLAPQASGVIHTDFEKKFIRAEVVNWQKLLEVTGPSTGSGQSPWAIAKQKGLIRLEGKEYVMQDGDVIVVRHG